MSTEDIGGTKWFLRGVCYKTSTIFGNVIKNKSDSTSIWMSMISNVKPLGHKISRMRIDNDTILRSKEFTLVFEFEGITVERVIPYSHCQLSRIERQWRTLADGAKILLLLARLPETPTSFGGMPSSLWSTSKTVVGYRDPKGFHLSRAAKCAYFG
jgi:hypothetical protein